jgi:hypothetical protein
VRRVRLSSRNRCFFCLPPAREPCAPLFPAAGAILGRILGTILALGNTDLAAEKLTGGFDYRLRITSASGSGVRSVRDIGPALFLAEGLSSTPGARLESLAAYNRAKSAPLAAGDKLSGFRQAVSSRASRCED